MKAEIISIGTEILLGEITNTNATFLAGQFPSMGIDLFFISDVGDNQQRLVEVLKQAIGRSDLVITTGGLGPTQDDITREAIAQLVNEEITIDQALVKQLERFFCEHSLEMSSNNLKQAGVIPSAQAIPNPRGTAPGWWIERDDHIIAALPGPPREMQFMWTNEIVPRLKHRIGEAAVIISRTLKTFGLGEAKVDEAIGHLMTDTNPTVGVYAKYDGIHVRITAKAASGDEARAMIGERESDISHVLRDYIWGVDDDTLESVIGSLCRRAGLTVASMEIGTGGLLAGRMSDSSAQDNSYYKGGLVANTEASLIALGCEKAILDQHGYNSDGAALSMATTVREKLGADIGIGITSALESTGNRSSSRTVFLGIDDGSHNYSFSRPIPGQQIQVKQRAIIFALFNLRTILMHHLQGV